MKLTVIIPTYNEINSLEELINVILKINFIKIQIILVDDCSNDGTKELIKLKLLDKIDKVIFHEKNLGKGASIKSAQPFVNGDIVLIQDADLEYDPNDYQKLLEPIIAKKTSVVYGSRVLGKNKYQNLENFSHAVRIWANTILTLISNLLNNIKLTDAHTCYKVFDANLFKKIKLSENGFGFCPEITTKVSNLNIKILEIPISYKGRTYSEGKKIKAIDGLVAIYVLIKYKFLN
tara:strand:- start:1204 stop:1905 length:702 start_codon:yes stop_codon:yes gene_type:complete